MSDLKQLRDLIDGAMSRDRGRLLGRWRALSRSSTPAAEALAKLARDVEQSRQRVATRASMVPVIQVDESLPIAARADEIVDLIRKHQVIVLAGETGSGKTTQLPKLCLAAGRGRAGMIGCTQPRRIAARTVARRVASELGKQVGDLVGFQVRFTEQVGENSLIKFMTDGILLAETQGDAWLSAYDTIILDEAHERSLNIDFLLGYLKRLLQKRRDLKLIVTSATIDTARFAAHFDNAPVVEVEGRTFPVEVRWRPALADADSAPAARTPGAARSKPGERKSSPAEPTTVEQIIAALDEISAEDPRGDVLIFLPGEREIRDTHLALSRRKYRHTEVVALYARLSAAEQDRVFNPGALRRIVLATNVAETSLTVPRIRYVIDTGTARVKRYGQRSMLERLHIEPISQAAADQRKGRCGRVAAGVCYRLYAEDDFEQRPRYTDPEIMRTSLAGVILRMLSLKLGDPEQFPFVEPPADRAIGDGYRRLAELGAIDEQRRLTGMGRALAQIPVDVALGRMLIEGHRLDVLRELLVLVAWLSIPDPRERPADARQQADAAHAPFNDPRSDFLGVLALWKAYGEAHAEFNQSRLRDWCKTHFLSYLRLREWRELHRQLLLIADTLSWPPERVVAADGEPPRSRQRQRRKPQNNGVDSLPENYEAIHRSLLSGWPTQVGLKDERNQFRGARERRFAVFPGSALAKSPPQWLLAGQIIDIGKVYAMHCARVDARWIEEQAAHLVKLSWRDPHWSRKRGAVMAFEQVSLFGLNLVEKRSVQFGRQDPDLAHQIFLREALASGDIDARADFIRANAKVLLQAHELEAQQRRSGLVKSSDQLADMLLGKMPADIHTSAGLDAWYRKASPSEQAALRWSQNDVLAGTPGMGANDFPLHLQVATDALRLEYRFVPGDDADGVTLHVPLALLNALPAAQCEWLVPGLLTEKTAELIRGLPKILRRNFVPAPDFARAFVESIPADVQRSARQGLNAALAAYLQRVTGVTVSADDFSAIELPAHLLMRFCVHDEQARILAGGRDLAALQSQWQGAARIAFAQRTDTDFSRDEVADFEPEHLPDTIVSASGMVAFPALVDLGDSVAMRVFEHRDEAQSAHRGGVERLLRRALAERIKSARRQLPLDNALGLKWAALGSAENLRADLVEAGLTECLRHHELDIRERSEFERVKSALGTQLFVAAVERLKLAEAIIEAHAELAAWMEPPLIGFARANYDDLREQREHLLAPGFLRTTAPAKLAHFPRYLRGMRLRAERLRQDPTRDQTRMLQVHTYWREYLKHSAGADVDQAALDELRWLIEELRVSLFAQELRTAEPVSAKRLGKAVAALG